MKFYTTYSIGVLSKSQGINPHKLNNADKFENLATIGVRSTSFVMTCPYKIMK